jgi:hypothetical protein
MAVSIGEEALRVTCPSVCTTQLIFSLNTVNLGMLIALILLIIFRKKISKAVLISGIILTIVVIALTSFRYISCGSGCDESGTYGVIQFLPFTNSVIYPPIEGRL